MMKKLLSEMTLEELWELFPIRLSAHQDCWRDWYQAEAERIRDFLADTEYVISHIGSTAINGIWAKPIVDILLEIPKTTPMEDIKNVLARNGYILMSEAENRASFNRGYTSEGFAEQVFHLHLRYRGDHDELYFRDYMNEYPSRAKQYEALKRSLWKQYEHNRDAYTQAKGPFIVENTVRAKQEYGGRYEDWESRLRALQSAWCENRDSF